MLTNKKNERLMLAAIFFFWFSAYTYPSFLSSFVVDSIGATKVMAGIIVGSYGLTQMILRIPLGIISDMLKRRKIFVTIGFVLSIISSLGLVLIAKIAISHGPIRGLAVAVLILRCLAGITASTWVNLSVLYSANYHGEEVAVAMSRIILPQYGSQILAMLLGAQLAGHVGEDYAFLLASIAAVIGTIVFVFVREQPPKGSPITLQSLFEVIQDRQLRVSTILATIYQLVVWATAQGFVQNWAREIIGVGKTQLGYLSVAYLLPSIILSQLNGKILVKKYSRRYIILSGFFLMALACFSYPRTNSLGSLLCVQSILGSGVGLIMPLTMAGAVECISDEKRGAAMGIYQAVYGLGMFLGPSIAGVIIERFSVIVNGSAGVKSGYSANFYFAMGIALFGSLLTVYLTQKSVN